MLNNSPRKRDGRARQWREERGLMEGWCVGLNEGNEGNADLLKFRSVLNSGSTHARDESRPPVLKRQNQNR